MGNKNTNLQFAKKARDDEFYTTCESIHQEVFHYTQHFKNKTVLCNCDDPFESNFCKFFLTSDLAEDSWILMSTSAFTLLR